MKLNLPWETSVLSDGTEWAVCEAGAGDLVAAVCGHDDMAEVRAKRIVTCVNACAGVESELLGPGVWKMKRDHIAAQHESLGKCAETMRAREAVINILQDRIVEMQQVLRQAFVALEYHQEQTRPIDQTEAALEAIRELLG